MLPRFPYRRSQLCAEQTGQPALLVENLSVAYGSGDQLALRNINVQVPNGMRLALVGHNGAGKSTLLKAVAGLLPPAAGSIRIFGTTRRRCLHRVAYLPQRGEIDWHFPITLRRLILAGRYVHLGWFKRPHREDFAVVDAAIEKLGLCALSQRQIAALSGGQQQRALFARALAQQADLLLLDEPFSAIDVATQALMRDLLAELKAQGKTIIAATHDLNHLVTNFDSAVYLEQGRIVESAIVAWQ